MRAKNSQTASHLVHVTHLTLTHLPAVKSNKNEGLGLQECQI